MTVQSPPPPPGIGPDMPGTPKKKGLSPLAWVGIGCGALLVIGFIVMAAGGIFAARKIKQMGDNPEMTVAEMMVRTNPDVELVSKDEDAKTITVRNKKTGEETTLNLSDIKNGNFKVEGADGKEASVQLGEDGIKVTDEKGNSTFQAGAGTDLPKDLPDWVPVYPGGQVQGTMSSDTPEQKTSSFTVTTQDSVADVIKFYQDKLAANGLEVEQTTTGSGADGSGGMISAKSSDDTRNVIIMIGSSSEGTGSSAQVTYIQKK
jgi:hypothetical protein